MLVGCDEKRRNDMTTLAQSLSISRSELMTLVFTAAFGIFLIGTAGFAQSEIAHNAAHDSRHAIAFPCH
jgi:cobalt transporter subunit CbtB